MELGIFLLSEPELMLLGTSIYIETVDDYLLWEIVAFEKVFKSGKIMVDLKQFAIETVDSQVIFYDIVYVISLDKDSPFYLWYLRYLWSQIKQTLLFILFSFF